MKPSDCKSKPQAVAAAQAIYEARIVVARITGLVSNDTDDALFKLEQAYWKRADELARKPRGKGGGRKGR